MLTFCRCSFHYSLHQQGCNDGGKVVVVSLLKQEQVDVACRLALPPRITAPVAVGRRVRRVRRVTNEMNVAWYTRVCDSGFSLSWSVLGDKTSMRIQGHKSILGLFGSKAYGLPSNTYNHVPDSSHRARLFHSVEVFFSCACSVISPAPRYFEGLEVWTPQPIDPQPIMIHTRHPHPSKCPHHSIL